MREYICLTKVEHMHQLNYDENYLLYSTDELLFTKHA